MVLKASWGCPQSWRMKFKTSSLALPYLDRIRSVTTRAPALIKGLRGMPFSYSSWTRELKALPEGSRPVRCQSVGSSMTMVRVNSLEML